MSQYKYLIGFVAGAATTVCYYTPSPIGKIGLAGGGMLVIYGVARSLYEYLAPYTSGALHPNEKDTSKQH
jgi:hypothetical protein